jgi:putative membrane-bound dehydrogenase-like protein
MRAIAALFLLVALPIASAQVGDRAQIDKSAPPAHWKMPPARLLSIEESLASFDLPEGFRLELIASEPLVQDPVLIQFDERGRLWVIEWPAYNWPLRKVLPGFDISAPPDGRVVMLEDTNDDGKMDRRTVIMEHAEWVRGLQLAQGGALALRLPQVVFATDGDGNGKLEREETIVSGLEVPVNVHNAQSNLLLAMDNWVYGSRFSERLRRQGGQWVRQPNVNLRGQWGLFQDNYGRLFYASNGDHLRADLVPSHYFARNPFYDQPAGIDVKVASDQTTWPQGSSPGTNRRAHLRDSDGSLQVFTSNTAPCIYRGDQFPAEYVGNVFLGDVAGRFMRRDVLTETDGLITARNAYDQREFMFSQDERFRPVYTNNGPDGALYIADMHRGVIEGDIFVTSYLRNQIEERKLAQPFNGLGRIYRLVHTGRPPKAPAPIARENSADWVERLAHANGFWRDTAQRILVENNDRSVIPAVTKIATGHRDEIPRLHALWTLEGLAAMSADVVQHALRDESAKVRIAALRLAEPFLTDANVAETVLALANDPRLEVRRQLIFTLGEGPGDRFHAALLGVVHPDVDAPITVEAAVSGLRGRELATIEKLLADSNWKTSRKGAEQFFSALAQSIVNSGDRAATERLLSRIADAKTVPEWPRLAMLDGLVAHPKPVAHLPEAFAALEASTEDAVRSRATKLKNAWTKASTAKATRAVTGELMERGQAMYAICAACHGPEGKGQPGIAPPLEGSAVVAGPVDDLVKGILQGRNLDRKNPAFPDMPPLAGLPDSDIAAISTYVRAKWGPPSRAVPLGRVRQLRLEVGAPPSPDSAPGPTPAAKK